MVKKLKAKKKKLKKEFPKGQFWFNVVSLSLLLVLAIVIGARSLYYYSLQHAKAKKEANTLAVITIRDHQIVKTGNGLYKINKEYVFKGQELSNYVMYSNRLFRIVKINEDNSVVLVADSNQTIMPWGDVANYNESNIYFWLNEKENVEYSGNFYKTLNDPQKYLKLTNWCEGVVKDNKIDCVDDNKDYVSLLTIEEYVDSLGTQGYLNDGNYTWLLGVGVDESHNNLYLSKTGSILSSGIGEGYGIKPVITLKNNVDVLSGNGSKDNPYIIEKETNMINKYVQLGTDLYRIQEEDDNLVKLSLNHYLQMNNQDYLSSYSKDTAEFVLTDRNNIGYFLNNKYLNSLSYRDVLSDCTFYTGEISDEVGYNYRNIYQNSVTAKVGMINMVDIKYNPELTDYYLMNTSSSLGEMAWVHDNKGQLLETIVKDTKKIVPMVCLDKNKIKNGNGSIDSPYVIE